MAGKTSILLFLLIVVGLVLSTSPGGEPTLYVKIKSKIPPQLRRLLESLHYDVLPKRSNEDVHVILSEEELQSLTTNNLIANPNDVQIVFNKTSEQQQQAPSDDGSVGELIMSGKVPKGYHSLQQINQFMRNIAQKHAKIAQIVNIAKRYGPGASHEKRPIYAIKISKNVKQRKQDKPTILIVAAHHAREVTTPEVAMYAMEQLTSQYGRDAELTRVVDDYQVWIVPVVNVDGYAYVFEKNNFWRKNRKPLGNNQYGVDLNRNYDLGWTKCVANVSYDDEVFKGKAPFSEPEAQTLRDFAKHFRPAKVIDFHSWGQEVLTGYLCTPIDTLIGKFINETGKELAKFANYSTRPPSDDGEHQQLHIKEHTNYAFLVEIGKAFQPTFAEGMKEVRRVWPLLRSFLTSNVPVRGHIYDAQTKRPVHARIRFPGIEWHAGESRQSHPKFGSYHLHMPKGTHVVTFEAQGYKPVTMSIEFPSTSEATLIKDILMQPILLSKQE